MSGGAPPRPSFAVRHPRLVSSFFILTLVVNTTNLAMFLVREGPAAWFFYGSGLALGLLLLARPWQLWTRRDALPSLSRTAPRWPPPAPSPFRRSRRSVRGTSGADPRR